MTASTKCILCGSAGHVLHEQVTDRLAQTPGSWSLYECENSQCGLIWIAPPPSKETLELAYKSYYTHKPLRERGRIRRFYERCKIGYLVSHFGYPNQLASFLEISIGLMLALLPHRRAAFDSSILWLPWVSGGKVLEVGCANGDRLALLKSLGWKTFGIEPDPQSARIASERGLDIITGILEPGKLPADSFDAIILSHVIEHLNNPVEAVKEFHRLLKPGGRLVLLTPNTKSFGHRKYGLNWLHLDPPRHLYLFNVTNIRLMLKSSGFSNIDAKTSLRDANWTLAGSRALKIRNEYEIGNLPVREKILGLLMLYHEWLKLMTNKLVGEDLLVIGQKER